MQVPTLIDIPASAQQEVQRRLDVIQSKHDVRILLAVESGSRAWGFASPDSDYDVRFIYAHKRDWYLSLVEKRDVIETPIENDMDVNGWDVRKALRLSLTSNPILIEWLTSPIVYRSSEGAAIMQRVVLDNRDRRALVRHYIGLLQNAWRRDFNGSAPDVPLKRYFYAIRPASALAWLRTRTDTPPMMLPALINGVALAGPLQSAITVLQRQKGQTHELGRGQRITEVDAFVLDHLQWGEAELKEMPQTSTIDQDALDNVFRGLIDQTA